MSESSMALWTSNYVPTAETSEEEAPREPTERELGAIEEAGYWNHGLTAVQSKSRKLIVDRMMEKKMVDLDMDV